MALSRSQTNAYSAVSDPRHDPRHPHHRTRFPSLTEFPDSPSVYSHAYHSPDVDVHTDTASFSHLSGLPCYPDCDDETASTIRSLSTEDVRNDLGADDCADDASHRISLQGPRIKFHSRAPWETDDDIPHDEESGSISRPAAFGSKLKGKVSRTDNLIRTFTRGSTTTNRPSVDSARSQVSVASSFDITARNYSSPHSALYDLARRSVSTSSLTSSSVSIRPQNITRMTDYAKSFQTRDSLPGATVDLCETVTPAIFERAPVPSPSDAFHASHECSARPLLVPLPQERQSHDQYVHPYANPDLVVPYTPSPETIPFHHPILGDITGNDSNSTATDSASTRSAAFSDISAETSATSLTSRDTPQKNLRINGKEISSPISVLHQSDTSYVDRSTRFLSLHPPPAGFEAPHRSNPNPRSTTVTLITLQEAQERERFRNNAVHTVVALSNPHFPSSDDISETAEDQTVEMDTCGKTDHTRARSNSIGTRHKPLPPTRPQNAETRDEIPALTSVGAAPGRTLRHKKSGFMRLFGSRNSEAENERSLPPPIPPLSDACAEENSQIHGTAKTSKLIRSRVPKSLSPALRGSGTSNATLVSTYSAASCGDTSDEKGSSRRRQPPSLSIITKTSDHGITTLALGTSSPTGLNFTLPSLSLAVPQSAPPGKSEFPGLELRPISTSFSSHFADMVTSTTEELQVDVHTPSSATSSNTALSPFTPVSTRRSDDASATVVEAPGEEHLTIKGLQDQFASAKKVWQQQIWELRGQIRDLTSELEDLRTADKGEYCEACGRGEPRKCYDSADKQRLKKVGIVNRPRARTGDSARFVNHN